MARKKRKLRSAQKAERARRRAELMTIFVNGKQKRVRRPPTIDGIDVDELIMRNADPIWLHQNEMWEYIRPDPDAEAANTTPEKPDGDWENPNDDIPF